MQKGHFLQFNCHKCKQPVCFSIFALDNHQITCAECKLIYDFNEETLKRQLQKFENLCRQIQLSEEILSNTAVGIYVGDREITIPYKLLLTRLNTTLQLMMDNQPLCITFRIEPVIDAIGLENYSKTIR